jgi:predicted small lipoprotein YifL
MSKMKKQFVWLLTAMMALLIVGCASQKGPAEQVIADAETALGAVRDQAQKYVPDQLQAVDAQVQSAKDAFAKGDYKGVLAAGPGIMTAISGLKDAASAKAADAEAALSKAKDAWSSVSADVPKMVDAIQSRVDILSKSHHLPPNVSKDSLAAAKSGLDSLKSTWSDASAAASSGDYTGAMAKAQAVKDKAADIMKSLGMTS